jgi:hypothetical protein
LAHPANADAERIAYPENAMKDGARGHRRISHNGVSRPIVNSFSVQFLGSCATQRNRGPGSEPLARTEPVDPALRAPRTPQHRQLCFRFVRFAARWRLLR